MSSWMNVEVDVCRVEECQTAEFLVDECLGTGQGDYLAGLQAQSVVFTEVFFLQDTTSFHIDHISIKKMSECFEYGKFQNLNQNKKCQIWKFGTI